VGQNFNFKEPPPLDFVKTTFLPPVEELAYPIKILFGHSSTIQEAQFFCTYS
jgi:hypothetical protein